MTHDIGKEFWSKCKICGKNLKEIKKEIGGTGIYFPQAFLAHIRQHNISPELYFTKYENLERPKCSCNECEQYVDVYWRGSKIFWKKYKCGKNEGVKKWSKEAKESRKGSGNPMYGKTPWNKGDEEFGKLMSQMKSGVKMSDEARENMSKSAKKRKVHGHTGHKHSKENIQKFRKNTAKKHAEGLYNHTETKPHREFRRILKKLNIQFEEEHLVLYYTFDFYLPEYNFYVEVDGDFFHCNPKFFPDGPKSEIQKRNTYNDIRKNSFCKNRGMNLIRFWEHDILNNKRLVKERLLECIRKKL